MHKPSTFAWFEGVLGSQFYSIYISIYIYGLVQVTPDVTLSNVTPINSF